GLTVTDGDDVVPPVAQVAAGDVVVVRPGVVRVVVEPPVGVVVEPPVVGVVVDDAAVVVVVAAAPKPTSSKAPGTVASSPSVARTEQFGDGDPLLQVMSSPPSVVKVFSTVNVSLISPFASAVGAPVLLLSQSSLLAGDALHMKIVTSPS